MNNEKDQRIAHIKERLIGLEPNTPEHQYYSDLLLSLVPPEVKLHVAQESACTSCE